MTTAHTPGPWRAEGQAISAPAREMKVAYVCQRYSNGAGNDETEANARLLAAAPDLLAALIECEAQLVREGTSKAWPAIEAARAAVAKARPSIWDAPLLEAQS